MALVVWCLVVKVVTFLTMPVEKDSDNKAFQVQHPRSTPGFRLECRTSDAACAFFDLQCCRADNISLTASPCYTVLLRARQHTSHPGSCRLLSLCWRAHKNSPVGTCKIGQCL